MLTVGTQDFAIRGFVIGSERQGKSDQLFCMREVVTGNFCREKKWGTNLVSFIPNFFWMGVIMRVDFNKSIRSGNES